MATNYNSDLSNEIRDTGKLQVMRDKIPSEFSDKIVLVSDVNPKHARRVDTIRRATVLNATSATVYTTPTDRDFFITHASLSVIKDVTSTSIYARLLVTIDGSNSVSILDIPGFSLTPQNDSVAVSFPSPIKVTRGTSINVALSTNVANATASACISGYHVDNPKA